MPALKQPGDSDLQAFSILAAQATGAIDPYLTADLMAARVLSPPLVTSSRRACADAIPHLGREFL